METTRPPRLDAKLLYRRLDSLLGNLDATRPRRELLESFLESAFATLKDDLRLRAALLYDEGRDEFRLLKQVGAPGRPAPAETLDRQAPPLETLYRHRVYIFNDPDVEGSPHRVGLLPRAASAAVLLGSRPDRQVLFFVLDEGWVHEELDFVLNTVRAALGARFVDERVVGSFKQAAEIQRSLLLDEPPEFAGYDIACRSVAAEEVGGDFYDFYPLNHALLGLAIGDASGHGLPAALLVRDVVTGLRIGIENDLKVAPVFTKLNRVIHRSNLSSRFVSVFYGELDTQGNVIYVNAGHQPPLLFSRGEVQSLTTGGTVIGPLPEADFHRGVARMERGDVLVMVTDGITDRRDADGEFFGVEGLKRSVGSRREAARDVLEAMFADAYAFGDERPWEDDATAMVVIRRPA
jgi:sigma-B regulation protein RsbU (phosphoserine phosphatase)